MKIPYYTVISGRGYWRPTPKMRALGFAIVACGPDGPEAWTIAAGRNADWQAARRGLPQPSEVRAAADHPRGESVTVYPAGSLGDAFARYRRLAEWRSKQPRTREDWWRGWKRIAPVFGAARPSDLTLEDLSDWREILEAKHGRREAHRALKIWRALWKVAAALKYCERDADPSLGVRNRAAQGRGETWSEGELVRLVKRAWRMGHRGLAAALAVMWDTQLSPGDVRALTPGRKRVDPRGFVYFATTRAKTETPVGGVLSPRTARVLQAYLAGLGAELLPDAPLFRTRGAEATAKGGRPWAPRPYTKDKFAEDFREVRIAEFGERENRQMLDVRRSGAVEAIAGDATAEKLSRAMGNTLSTSNALFETYAPAELAPILDVAAARRKGRSKRRGEG